MLPGGPVRKEVLLGQCAALGLGAGDTLMLHVSLRAVGPVLGGPDLLIAGLREAVGPDGTLLAYVGCETPYDDIGRGCYSAEEEAIFRKELPAFDHRTARACRDFGAFAELFRSHPGALCSGNPGARVAALGARAEALTRDHPLDDGYGRDSPLERLCAAGGKVVLLGSDPDQVTLLHYAEAVAPIAGKRTVRIETPLLVEGTRTWVAYQETDTSTGIRAWPRRFFAGIVEAYAETGRARSGRLAAAPALVLDAAELVAFALPRLVEEAARLDEVAKRH